MATTKKTREELDLEFQELHELIVAGARALKIDLPTRDNLRANRLRFCLGCERVLPANLEYFRKNPTSSDGLSARCRPCFNRRSADAQRARQHFLRALAQPSTSKEHGIALLLWSFRPDDLVAQLTRQQHRCFWCGQPLGQRYAVSHLVPLNMGGTTFPENICCSCHSCDRKKADLMPEEFIERFGLHHVTMYRGEADPSRDP